MKNKKLWIGIAFLGLTLMVASAAILFRKPPEVYAGKPIFHGETTTYRYSGEVLEHTGDVLVNVYYLRGGDKAIHAYREANIKRSYALLARKDPQLIWVQVTFARPIPIAEVSSLVKETGFKVQDFLMAGRSSQGGRAWCIDAIGNLDQPVCDPDFGDLGVMVLQGWVETTERGLGRWMADDRVYMIDTIAVEVSELLAQRHADIVAGRKIVIDSESPFWLLDW
ncbi:MAG: hypothetical protein C4309_14250 [Chloroflexota bacterium]